MADKRQNIGTIWTDRKRLLRMLVVDGVEGTALTPSRIGKSDDDLGRMLEVLRFWFTKDLVRSKTLRHPDL